MTHDAFELLGKLPRAYYQNYTSDKGAVAPSRGKNERTRSAMPNRNSGSLSFLATALLTVLPRLASGANTTIRLEDIDEFGSEGCGFIHSQPRFYQLLAGLTLQNVALPDTLVNDALIRTLRRLLMVSECQIILSEGIPCTSGTQELPCANPVHLCPSSASTGSGQIALTDDLYDAIITESCDRNGDGLVDMLDGTMSTLVCGQVLEFGRAVQTLVRQGACTAVCDINSLIDGNGAVLDEDPKSPGSSCLNFDLTLNLATEQAAMGLQEELLSAGTSNAVEVGLSGFGSDPLVFSVIESTIGDAVGFGFFPPPPPPPPPVLQLVEGAPASERTNASSKTVEYGKWTPCYPSCGDGISTRTVTCVAPDGAVLPLAECPEALVAESSKSCSTVCEAPYWQYGPWQTCDRRCGTGQSTRTAICVSDGVTKCAGQDKEPLNRECNTISCEVFAWIQSPWSECSASCGGGMQSRNVTCVGPDGSEAPSSSCDPSTMPSTSNICNTTPCEFCQSTACLGRGMCSEGRCECTSGYRGAHCEAHSSCGTGVVASNLACCASGVLDARGGCCADGSSVDAAGECCDGSVDACGVCNGSGKYVDIQGQCCAVVDADGICCASGLIDECGVCNGVGNTCSIVLGLNVRVPSNLVADGNVQPATIDAYLDLVANTTGISPDRISLGDVALASGSTAAPGLGRKLLQSTTPPGGYTNLLVEVEIAPNANKPSEVPFSSAYYAQILPEVSSRLNSEEFAIEAVPVAARRGFCGNDICEIGERTIDGVSVGTCSKDCGLPSKACPGGCGNGGVCLPAAGVCQCRDEYTGSSCGECAPGYSRSGDSTTCVTNVADQGIISEAVLGPNGEALVSGTDSSGGTPAGVIVGAVFGALIGTALIILAVVLVRRRYMYGSRKKRFVSNELYQDRPESSDASDLGLRKKYGLAPHTFGYSEGCEAADQIGVGQYDFSHENPMYSGVVGGGNQQDDPEHRVMYVTGATLDTTSSDQNSGFVRELFVKDPSPDRIQVKLAQQEPQVNSEDEHSAYIKAAQMPQSFGMDGQDAPDEDEELFPAQSLENLSPNTRHQNAGCYVDDHFAVECESVGPESRMVFNPAFDIRGEAPRSPDDYPKTVDVDHPGSSTEMRDLDARREKLNALRAVVRSLENSRAPSRETSFTGTAIDSENMVDLESIAGRTLPPKPDGVPELALPGMQPKPTGRPATHAPTEKEAGSFFATVKRALTPPRFRRPISATESSDEMNRGISRSSSMGSMGSFTKVLMEVDDALQGRETNATKKTTFDATHL